MGCTSAARRGADCAACARLCTERPAGLAGEPYRGLQRAWSAVVAASTAATDATVPAGPIQRLYRSLDAGDHATGVLGAASTSSSIERCAGRSGRGLPRRAPHRGRRRLERSCCDRPTVVRIVATRHPVHRRPDDRGWRRRRRSERRPDRRRPADPRVVYRDTGERVERSVDGGLSRSPRCAFAPGAATSRAGGAGYAGPHAPKQLTARRAGARGPGHAPERSEWQLSLDMRDRAAIEVDPTALADHRAATDAPSLAPPPKRRREARHGAGAAFSAAICERKRRRRSALATTETLDSAIAAPARTGLRRPSAATGRAATL